ncbi:hypothetical protein Mp_zg00110 [Marchantia polymorpha subsp. ruderalis]|uniref:F-box domain-containing protein n=2 Tax=Marchantia polymorpha TaxID=3197 RepID=A0A679DXP2_MARPO|nr:hypothetical protein MARPO_1528s0001 [Marchantia polymorpha]BBN20679.1 hypothetical protein Mp_zg00110 [Marchantia polymorpha subsp. ruderalis]|eukprot:PTQ26464.1 hypothetical protein MARPO_1528s0001 [Marchantia polymorpha]
MPSTMGEHEDLPNDLMMKIFRRVPYPEIVKVRLLSTEWNSNFRTLVSQTCHTWPTYCPLYTVKVKKRTEDGRRGCVANLYKVGYDCAEGHFRILGETNLSYGRAFSRSDSSSRCGALLVRVVFQEHRALATVINHVTGQRNHVWFSNLEAERHRPRVFPVGAEHYEIVICHYTTWDLGKFSVTVYKSVSKDHTTRSFSFDDAREPLSFYVGRLLAYDDGVLYLPKFYLGYITVLRLNMKKGAMSEITVGPLAHTTLTKPAVLLCGSRIVCVLVDKRWNEQPIARVYHVVPVSSESILLSTWQIELFSTAGLLDEISFASNRSSIFITQCNIPVIRGSGFRERTFRSRTVCYDVDANVWTSIYTPFCEYSSEERLKVESFVFEPGLNPLASP